MIQPAYLAVMLGCWYTQEDYQRLADFFLTHGIKPRVRVKMGRA